MSAQELLGDVTTLMTISAVLMLIAVAAWLCWRD